MKKSPSAPPAAPLAFLKTCALLPSVPTLTNCLRPLHISPRLARRAAAARPDHLARVPMLFSCAVMFRQPCIGCRHIRLCWSRGDSGDCCGAAGGNPPGLPSPRDLPCHSCHRPCELHMERT
jgi:hypothetical protein